MDYYVQVYLYFPAANSMFVLPRPKKNCKMHKLRALANTYSYVYPYCRALRVSAVLNRFAANDSELSTRETLWWIWRDRVHSTLPFKFHYADLSSGRGKEADTLGTFSWANSPSSWLEKLTRPEFCIMQQRDKFYLPLFFLFCFPRESTRELVLSCGVSKPPPQFVLRTQNVRLCARESREGEKGRERKDWEGKLSLSSVLLFSSQPSIVPWGFRSAGAKRGWGEKEKQRAASILLGFQGRWGRAVF